MEFLLDPRYWWAPLGAAAFLLALVTLFRAIAGKKRGQGLLQLGSLSCALGCLLALFGLIDNWVDQGDWSALMDVVPALARYLPGAVAVGLGLHLAALVIDCRRGN